MRVMFLGQKPIGVKCFEYLLRSKIDVRIVCTNYERNTWWGTNDVFLLSNIFKIPHISNDKRKTEEILSLIREHEIDTIISVEHPWIIEQGVLDAVNGNAYNLHMAKIPDYRGYNVCIHAILNKEKTFTVTIHKMIKDVDLGRILYENTFDISNTDTAKSLYSKSEDASMIVFKEFIHDLQNNSIIGGHEVALNGNFYERKFGDLDRIKDITNFDEVDLKARAFYFPPFSPAYYLHNNNKYFIYHE